MTPAIATVIGAVLSGIVAIAVSLINSRAQHRVFMSKLDKQDAMQQYRLEQLEKKVDQHNHFDRRIVALEEQVKTLFSSMKE